ncbi:MAG: hypothetical protein LBH97_07640 [Treponema sp.]|jgi:hypothetical protein|nr:hypothetical protein [Treponema sp.]
MFLEEILCKIAVFCITFLFCGKIYSQEIGNLSFYGTDALDPFYVFDNNNLNFMSFAIGLPENEIRTTYTYALINGIYYFTISHTPEIKAVLLYNNEFGYVSIYSPVQSESGLLLRHDLPDRIKINRHIAWYSFHDVKINTSSFLVENNIRYDGNNLKQSIKDGPWVEGVSGNGIGEYIEMDYTGSFIGEINGIVISNGFVSANNPDLFLKNNRVKRILIEGNNDSFRNEYDILDTPNLQTIMFPMNVSKIKITILDIYEGTTWDDTCINMIIGIKL